MNAALLLTISSSSKGGYFSSGFVRFDDKYFPIAAFSMRLAGPTFSPLMIVLRPFRELLDFLWQSVTFRSSSFMATNDFKAHFSYSIFRTVGIGFEKEL